jgi:hypothetical protein
MNHIRNIRAAIVLAITITLTGCMYPGGTVPQHTPHDGLSRKTEPQLLDEALQQTYDIAQLIGGEWLDSGVPPNVFDPTDPEQRATVHRASCDDEATTFQYSVFVIQRADPSTEFDPEALSQNVRTYWEGLGYTTRQIGPPAQDTTRGRSINVDLPHSAGLQFFASTKALSIWVDSECTHWD